MMRIGYDVTVLYCARGGISRYTVSLLRGLRTLAETGGMDADLTLVDYAPARGPWPLGRDAADADILHHHAQVTTLEGPRLRKLRTLPWLNVRGGRRLARMVDGWLDAPQRWWIERQTMEKQRQLFSRLDVFHASDVTQLRPRRVGLVATVFDLSPLHWPEFHLDINVQLFHRKMNYVCRHADRIIAISHYTAEDLLEHYPTTQGRIDVVHCAAESTFHPIADPQRVAGVRRAYGIPASGYLLSVGTLEPRKNLTRLIEAYAHVRATTGTSTPPLVLAGARGWREQPIFDTVERLGLQGEVIFPGPIVDADLPALYSGATGFIYPSLFEGFGLPVLEAMACGTPVITSNTSSLPEVTGDAAILIPPEDVDALTGALLRLLDDTQLQERLRALGKVQARHFSWEKAAQETFAVYQRAAG